MLLSLALLLAALVLLAIGYLRRFYGEVRPIIPSSNLPTAGEVWGPHCASNLLLRQRTLEAK